MCRELESTTCTLHVPVRRGMLSRPVRDGSLVTVRTNQDVVVAADVDPQSPHLADFARFCCHVFAPAFKRLATSASLSKPRFDLDLPTMQSSSATITPATATLFQAPKPALGGGRADRQAPRNGSAGESSDRPSHCRRGHDQQARQWSSGREKFGAPHSSRTRGFLPALISFSLMHTTVNQVMSNALPSGSSS